MGPKHDVNGIEYGVDTVLVLAGIELIFLLVAGIVLWFGFSIRIMWIATTENISVLSSVYNRLRIFQLLMPSQQEGWRGTRSWQGTQPGQLTQTGQQVIPYHVKSHLVYKLGGEGGWEGLPLGN